MLPVVLVVASKVDQNSFLTSTWLGQSLKHMPQALCPGVALTPNNFGNSAQGLSEIYNQAIDAPSLAGSILVFVHDDVYLHDWFINTRVNDAVSQYDVVGIAGSVNPNLKQPNWMLEFDQNHFPTGQIQNGLTMSGAVNHFNYACPNFDVFGDTPADCQLLDGLFLAVDNNKIQKNKAVRFDPQFKFHLYDMDFCRTASKNGLKLGTWPIAVTHASGGNFNSPEFRTAAKAYLSKW